MGNQLRGKRTVAMLLSIAIVFFAIFVHIPTVHAASKAALAKKSGSVVIGGTQNIRVKNVPKGAKITYKSRKASVAVVSKKGKVTGVKAGTADISVIVKKGKAKTKLSYKLTVKKPAFSKSELSLGVKEKIAVSLKNKPLKSAKIRYVWSSENRKVAKVENGIITGIAEGSTNIRVKIKSGKKFSYTIKCMVNVTKKKPVSVSQPTEIMLNQKQATLKTGNTFTLVATVIPEGSYNKNVSWSSSNTSVATVQNGVVTGVSAGTAMITARTVNGKTDVCTVTVTAEPTLSFDEFAQAGAELIKESGEPSGASIAENGKFASKRLIVRGKNTKLDFSDFHPKAVVKSEDGVYLIQFASVQDVKTAFSKLSNWPEVEWVEPDTYNDVDANGSVSPSAKSWGVEKIGADKYADAISGIQSSIVVAVVDTGISNHTFLNGRIQNGGYDFVDNDLVPSDEHYHGTHVAGTIVDCTPGLNVKVLPVRVLNARGSGSDFNVANGVQYAANHGAKIINLSLGGGHSNYIDEKINDAVKKGVVVVAAAGNENSDTVYFCPAHLNSAIVVAALDQYDRRASFSNYGTSVDVAAPGVGIISCVPGGSYRSLDGTSMAAPHVSAVAAMFRLKYPSMDPVQIEKLVKETTRDLGSVGWDKYFGYGIPDLGNVYDTEPKRIKLDKNNAVIEPGKTVTLVATIEPENATDKTVSWSSMNTSVAVVNDGKVTGISEGTTIITAKTFNGKTANCTVSVKTNVVEPTEITLDHSSVTLETGKKVTLNATIKPDNVKDKTVSWSSANTSVATVKDGTITGISKGTTTVTAKTVNGKTASCVVKVSAVKVEPTEITLDKNHITMKEDDTVVLTATVKPNDATDKTVVWSSSDTSVATVNNGRVTGKSVGKATIFARTVNGKAVTCYVTVISKNKLTLNYSDITLYANDHGNIALFNMGGGNSIAVKEGEMVQAGINVNFSYSNVPGLHLKAYLDGDELLASQVSWASEKHYGYGSVDQAGYVKGMTNGFFVTMSVSPTILEQTITATLKSNPSVSAKVNIKLVYDAKMKFSIADASIASVDERGVVTGKRAGSTTLTMRSELTGKSVSCVVTVGGAL